VSSSPTEVRDVEKGARTIEIAMPQMGISVAEGTIVEWRKRPGDWVEADEPVCDVSTDKVDVEIPSPAAGRLGALWPCGSGVECAGASARRSKRAISGSTKRWLESTSSRDRMSRKGSDWRRKTSR